MEASLYFTTVIAYAQGMHLLSQASKEYGYELKLDQIALIWRGGCIIRSKFLQEIYQAYKTNNKLEHLLLDAGIAKNVKEALSGMRQLVSAASASGLTGVFSIA